jgi:hypothetical protein
MGPNMSDVIFQVSDLATTKRTEFVSAARDGRAVLRDKDGLGLVMLPEAQLSALEELAEWSQALLRLEALIRRETPPSVVDLGNLAWLRPFDLDDLREFAAELNDVLLAAYADRNLSVLNQCLADWRTTARQLQDPLRRSVLLARHQPDDFIEAERPGDADGGE